MESQGLMGSHLPEVLRVDGYNPKLHALTGEAHGMAAALNVPRVSCCVLTVFGWLATKILPTKPAVIYKWGENGNSINGRK